MNQKILKVVTPLVVLFVGFVIAWGIVQAKEEVPRELTKAVIPVVRTLDVSLSDVDLVVELHGNVRAATQIEVISEVSGKVSDLSPNFEAGAFYDTKSPLAMIDTRDYETAVTQAKAMLAQAEVRLAQEKAEAQIALDDWESYGNGGEPDALVKREPQIASAKADKASAEAALAQATLNLSRCAVVPEFAGRVVSKRVDLGQFVRAGEVIGVVHATQRVEVEVAIPDYQIPFIDLPMRAGDLSQPTVDCYARIGPKTEKWVGKIVRTAAMIDARTRTLGATIQIDDPFAGERMPLIPGSFVRVEIAGRHVQNVVVLPVAVMRDANTLLTVDDKNRLKHRTVDVLRVGPEEVYIQGGLEVGEKVCLTTLNAVVDGMLVKVAKEEADEEASDMDLEGESTAGDQESDVNEGEGAE